MMKLIIFLQQHDPKRLITLAPEKPLTRTPQGNLQECGKDVSYGL